MSEVPLRVNDKMDTLLPEIDIIFVKLINLRYVEKSHYSFYIYISDGKAKGQYRSHCLCICYIQNRVHYWLRDFLFQIRPVIDKRLRPL
jgi:hypothetical protein